MESNILVLLNKKITRLEKRLKKSEKIKNKQTKRILTLLKETRLKQHDDNMKILYRIKQIDEFCEKATKDILNIIPRINKHQEHFQAVGKSLQMIAKALQKLEQNIIMI